jgi:hypothetical protein
VQADGEVRFDAALAGLPSGARRHNHHPFVRREKAALLGTETRNAEHRPSALPAKKDSDGYKQTDLPQDR